MRKNKVKLNENVLRNIIRRVLREQEEDYSDFGLEPSPEDKKKQESDAWDNIDSAYKTVVGGDEDDVLNNMKFRSEYNPSQDGLQCYPGHHSMEAMEYLDNGETDDSILYHTGGRNCIGDQRVFDSERNYSSCGGDPFGDFAQSDLEFSGLAESIRKSIRKVLREQ